MIACNKVVGKTGFYLYIVLLRPARPNKVMWLKEMQSICRMFLKCYVNVSVPHQNILCNKSKTHNTKFGVMGDTYPAVGVTSD